MSVRGWFDVVTWPKAFILGIVVLIITRIVAPDTAAWILGPIIELFRIGVNAAQNLGGTP